MFPPSTILSPLESSQWTQKTPSSAGSGRCSESWRPVLGRHVEDPPCDPAAGWMDKVLGRWSTVISMYNTNPNQISNAPHPRKQPTTYSAGWVNWHPLVWFWASAAIWCTDSRIHNPDKEERVSQGEDRVCNTNIDCIKTCNNHYFDKCVSLIKNQWGASIDLIEYNFNKNPLRCEWLGSNHNIDANCPNLKGQS